MENTPIKSVYHKNYDRLEKIFACNLAEIKSLHYLKLQAKPYMDLHIDILSRKENGFTFSMAHNFEQNGDLVPDPDMEIEIDLLNKTAEALTYQNMYIYSEVYQHNDKGERTHIKPKLKKDLNSFLSMWTKNLIEQRHTITSKKEEEI